MKPALCPRCYGVIPPDGPQGMCPKCLLAVNMGEPEVIRTQAGDPMPPPPTPEDIQPLFPHLEIVRLIGRGGMGAVYEARQRGLNRRVALKLLWAPSIPDAGFEERFSREGQALAHLSHDNIVAVHDAGKSGAYYWLVMEYVDGPNLRQLLQVGRLAPAKALPIVMQMCSALDYAHQQGVVHRDIKPENVLVTAAGRVKIADFGLAKILARDHQGPMLTRTFHAMGTPHYMAPEQIEHPKEVDHRADIYSLGVVLYEVLTGELPLGRFQMPSRKVKVDGRLDDIVARALQKDPARRYQAASDVGTAVRAASERPRSRPQPIESSRPSRLAWPVALAITVVATILVTWWAINRSSGTSPMVPARQDTALSSQDTDSAKNATSSSERSSPPQSGPKGQDESSRALGQSGAKPTGDAIASTPIGSEKSPPSIPPSPAENSVARSEPGESEPSGDDPDFQAVDHSDMASAESNSQHAVIAVVLPSSLPQDLRSERSLYDKTTRSLGADILRLIQAALDAETAQVRSDSNRSKKRQSDLSNQRNEFVVSGVLPKKAGDLDVSTLEAAWREARKQFETSIDRAFTAAVVSKDEGTSARLARQKEAFRDRRDIAPWQDMTQFDTPTKSDISWNRVGSEFQPPHNSALGGATNPLRLNRSASDEYEVRFEISPFTPIKELGLVLPLPNGRSIDLELQQSDLSKKDVEKRPHNLYVARVCRDQVSVEIDGERVWEHDMDRGAPTEAYATGNSESWIGLYCKDPRARLSVVAEVKCLGRMGTHGATSKSTSAGPERSTPSALDRPILDGLRWLARHQTPEGFWGALALKTGCVAESPCYDAKLSLTDKHDVGLTGLALLGFLGAGYDDESKQDIVDSVSGRRYKLGEVVQKGLQWLEQRQNPDGSFSNDRPFMYDEALATMAVVEAYRVTRSESWKQCAQRGIEFLQDAQRPNPSGEGQWGWRYTSRGEIEKTRPTTNKEAFKKELYDSDTSITTWCLLALTRGRSAGLQVRQEAVDGAMAFCEFVTANAGLVGYLDSKSAGATVTGPFDDRFTYHPTTMSALGMCIRISATSNAQDGFLDLAANRLIGDLPTVSQDNSSIDYYYWHQATLALALLEGRNGLRKSGKHWGPWKEAATAAVLSLQDHTVGACTSGGWIACDRWGNYSGSGPIYGTALNIMTLECMNDSAAVGSNERSRRPSGTVGNDGLKGSPPVEREKPRSALPSPQLLKNPSCEDPIASGGIPGWKTTSGGWQQRSDDPSPQDGLYYFWPTPCDMAELQQKVDLGTYLRDVQSGRAQVEFQCYLRGWRNRFDTAEAILDIVDASGTTLTTSTSGETNSKTEWILYSETIPIPINARAVIVRLVGRRREGNNNDGYFDNLSLRVTPASSEAEADSASPQVGASPASRSRPQQLPPTDSEFVTISISGASMIGYEVGPVTHGCHLSLQYVTGKWKAWGRYASENPDAENQERGEACRLAVVLNDNVIAVVPPGTAQTPFVLTIPTDGQLILRINDDDGDWDSNPDAAVTYRMQVK